MEAPVWAFWARMGGCLVAAILWLFPRRPLLAGVEPISYGGMWIGRVGEVRWPLSLTRKDIG